MSNLSLFRPHNHPQQPAQDSIDDRSTPDRLYRQFDDRFHFTIDVAASPENAKTPSFYDLQSDGLASTWADHRVWCNPPYSALDDWLKKASRERHRCPVIVMLLPANRTEQPFWQIYIEPHRDGRSSWLSTEFIAKRWNFGYPDGRKTNSSPLFGLVAVIFQERGARGAP